MTLQSCRATTQRRVTPEQARLLRDLLEFGAALSVRELELLCALVARPRCRAAVSRKLRAIDELCDEALRLPTESIRGMALGARCIVGIAGFLGIGDVKGRR